MAKSRKDPSRRTMSLPIINSQAAGIDIGSRFHVVAVGQDKEKDMATFGVTTPDLHELAQFLKSRSIQSIAMESTGYYWIPLYWMLKSYDFDVIVINSADIKRINAPKTDPKDARWLQKLHALGLLKASFQLDCFSEMLRAYGRRRRQIITERTRQLSRMHKVLVLMNVQIGTQLTNLGGVTGMKIIHAIVAGQTDPNELIKLVYRNVKTPKEELLKALQGTWQPQYLFELKQLLQTYELLNVQLDECDKQIEQELEEHCRNNGMDLPNPNAKPTKREAQSQKHPNAPNLKIIKILQSLTGAQILEVGGVGGTLILDLASELGFTLDQFPSSKHFTSWLGLAPNRKISGGKVLSSRTPKRRNYAAQAFRQAANAIGNCRTHPLKPFFVSILKRQGRKGAITATARKLAVIYYHMVREQTPFQYQTEKEYEVKRRSALIKRIQKTVKELNIQSNELTFV